MKFSMSKKIGFVLSIGLISSPMIAWAENPNFDSTTGILTVPIVSVDKEVWYEDVELKLNFSTSKFSLLNADPIDDLVDTPVDTPVPTENPIVLEQLDDDSFLFNATAGQSYVVELFNVARSWEDINGNNCDDDYGSEKGVGLRVVADSSSTEITKQCNRQGFGNVHNSMKFDAGVGGEIQIDVIPNLADVDISGKFSIRVHAEHDDPSAAWDTNFEPNNLAVNAYPIAIGAQNALSSKMEERSSSFGTSQSDFDWYHIDATADQYYLIEIFNVIGLLGTTSGENCDDDYGSEKGVGLKVNDFLFSQLGQSCDPNGTGNVYNQIQFKAGIGGVFHIGVIPNSPTAFGTYSIRVLPFHDDPLASWDAKTYEPNNAPINAFLIAPSEVITSQIEERNASYATVSSDVDYYRFEAEASQTYRVELFDVASLLSTEKGDNCDGDYGSEKGVALQVLDSMFVQLGLQCDITEEGDIHNSLEFRTGLSGTYYIGVIPNSFTAYGAYSLRLSKK